MRRAGVELTAGHTVPLHYGDTVLAVGEPTTSTACQIVGNSSKRLDHPEIIPIFVGIVLGVIAGSWPFHLPGMPAPVKLGLAGGPLLVAIVLSRIGQIGPVTWYMPASANFIVRELGIALFLAASVCAPATNSSRPSSRARLLLDGTGHANHDRAFPHHGVHRRGLMKINFLLVVRTTVREA